MLSVNSISDGMRIKSTNKSKAVGARQKRRLNSKGIFPWIGMYINMVHYFGVLTFVWDSKKEKFFPAKSQLIKVNTFFIASLLGYEIYRLISELRNPNLVITEITLIQICLFGYSIFIMSLLNAQLKQIELVYMMNCLTSDVFNSKENQGKTEIKYSRLEKLLSKWMFPTFASMSTFVILTMIILLPGKHLIADILPSNDKNKHLKLLLHVYQAIPSLTAICSTFIQLLCMLIYIFRDTHFLRHIRTNESDFDQTVSDYNKLWILNMFFNNSFVSMYTPTFVISYSFYSLLGAFCSIRFYEILTWVTYAVYPCTLFICLNGLTALLIGFSICWKNSFELRAHMESSLKIDGSNYRRKMLRATRPYGIRVGPIKAVKYERIFDFYDCLINTLVTLLMTII